MSARSSLKLRNPREISSDRFFISEVPSENPSRNLSNRIHGAAGVGDSTEGSAAYRQSAGASELLEYTQSASRYDAEEEKNAALMLDGDQADLPRKSINLDDPYASSYRQTRRSHKQ